jgi:hypothetical protein
MQQRRKSMGPQNLHIVSEEDENQLGSAHSLQHHFQSNLCLFSKSESRISLENVSIDNIVVTQEINHIEPQQLPKSSSNCSKETTVEILNQVGRETPIVLRTSPPEPSTQLPYSPKLPKVNLMWLRPSLSSSSKVAPLTATHNTVYKSVTSVTSNQSASASIISGRTAESREGDHPEQENNSWNFSLQLHRDHREKFWRTLRDKYQAQNDYRREEDANDGHVLASSPEKLQNRTKGGVSPKSKRNLIKRISAFLFPNPTPL